MEYYSEMKKMNYGTMRRQRNLKYLLLSEVSQIERATCCMTPITYVAQATGGGPHSFSLPVLFISFFLCSPPFFLSFFFFFVLGIEPRASRFLGRCCAAELSPLLSVLLPVEKLLSLLTWWRQEQQAPRGEVAAEVPGAHSHQRARGLLGHWLLPDPAAQGLWEDPCS